MIEFERRARMYTIHNFREFEQEIEEQQEEEESTWKLGLFGAVLVFGFIGFLAIFY